MLTQFKFSFLQGDVLHANSFLANSWALGKLGKVELTSDGF